MAVVKLTADTFDSEVLKADGTVLVDFYADWCGPCKMLSPVVEALAERLTDCKVCKLNVDEASDVAARYKVMSIPTLIVFRQGKAAAQSVGVQSAEAIEKMVRG